MQALPKLQPVGLVLAHIEIVHFVFWTHWKVINIKLGLCFECTEILLISNLLCCIMFWIHWNIIDIKLMILCSSISSCFLTSNIQTDVWWSQIRSHVNRSKKFVQTNVFRYIFFLFRLLEYLSVCSIHMFYMFCWACPIINHVCLISNIWERISNRAEYRDIIIRTILPSLCFTRFTFNL